MRTVSITRTFAPYSLSRVYVIDRRPTNNDPNPWMAVWGQNNGRGGYRYDLKRVVGTYRTKKLASAAAKEENAR